MGEGKGRIVAYHSVLLSDSTNSGVLEWLKGLSPPLSFLTTGLHSTYPGLVGIKNRGGGQVLMWWVYMPPPPVEIGLADLKIWEALVSSPQAPCYNSPVIDFISHTKAVVKFSNPWGGQMILDCLFVFLLSFLTLPVQIFRWQKN